MARNPVDRPATAPPPSSAATGARPDSSPPRARADEPAPPLGPTTGGEQEPILDVLRGFALLGILLVNIEVLRGPLLYRGFAEELEAPAGLDQVLQFLVGWLAAGKFVSSFAIMFGIGAALMVDHHRPGSAGDVRDLGDPAGHLPPLATLLPFGARGMALAHAHLRPAPADAGGLSGGGGRYTTGVLAQRRLLGRPRASARVGGSCCGWRRRIRRRSSIRCEGLVEESLAQARTAHAIGIRSWTGPYLGGCPWRSCVRWPPISGGLEARTA